MKVIRATTEHLAQAMALAMKFVKECPFQELVPKSIADEKEAFDALGAMINNGIVLLAIHDDGRAVGIIGGYVTSWWWKSAAKIAMEMLWYVEPTARGGRAALATLNGFEAAAREAGANWTMMQAGVVEDAVAKRVLQKRGYQMQGPICIKEL